jgi:hypothetical protein
MTALLMHLQSNIYIVCRGDFLGLEEMNNNGRKTMDTGTMDRDFTVN